MTDLVNDYFQRFYPSDEQLECADYRPGLVGMTIRGDEIDFDSTLFPSMVCADGFSMSVQGHHGAYSHPRDDFAERYTTVEVGFPSEPEPLLGETNEGDVWAYVPIETVIAIIEKHGGMKEAT